MQRTILLLCKAFNVYNCNMLNFGKFRYIEIPKQIGMGVFHFYFITNDCFKIASYILKVYFECQKRKNGIKVFDIGTLSFEAALTEAFSMYLSFLVI